MGTNVKQRGNVQTVKRGRNNISRVLADREPRGPRAQYQNNKHLQSMSKLMNCKTVDKFDYGEHPNYPKAKPQRKRKLSRAELRSWMQAGAEIRVDKWAFVRNVVYQNHILGTCTDADLVALTEAGYMQPFDAPHGTVVYRKV